MLPHQHYVTVSTLNEREEEEKKDAVSNWE